MKKQLLKKLSTLIVTAMMFSASANAQIVYTDVIPDIVKTCSLPGTGICSEMDSIDLNNDGIFDLQLSLQTKNIARPNGLRSGFVKVSPLHGSAIATNSSGPLYRNLNDVINSGGSWSTTADQILISRSITNTGGTLVTGNWTAATDEFLGLTLVSGSQSYYCWVRLNVSVVISGSTSATFTLKDYAYNSIPNQAILAGQTTATGIIENSFASSINLFPNPATNHLTVALGSNNKKVEVTIADITGKVIYTTIATDTQKVEVNTKDFAEGIYTVQIQTADFIATKRLVVEK